MCWYFQPIGDLVGAFKHVLILTLSQGRWVSEVNLYIYILVSCVFIWGNFVKMSWGWQKDHAKHKKIYNTRYRKKYNTITVALLLICQISIQNYMKLNRQFWCLFWNTPMSQIVETYFRVQVFLTHNCFELPILVTHFSELKVIRMYILYYHMIYNTQHTLYNS